MKAKSSVFGKAAGGFVKKSTGLKSDMGKSSAVKRTSSAATKSAKKLVQGSASPKRATKKTMK